MARTINRLSAVAVRNAKAKGLYPDGGGLYLQVSTTGTKSWLFRFAVGWRERMMGLGSVDALSLGGARDAAAECRRLRSLGIDPIEQRRGQRDDARLTAARRMTFDECAAAYINGHEAGWRNAKHRAQWVSTLATYVSPVLGSLPVQAIEVALVLRVLEPIWTTKPETAGRVRGRIEAILDWSTARGHRVGENPARWRGHLAKLLPARSKVRRVKHHAALPFDEIPQFMAALRSQEGVGALALEFSILTIARTSETTGATWNEINAADKIWIVPPDRMKAEKEHRVPLSGRALEILKTIRPIRHADEAHVFPGRHDGKPLSDMAMLKLLKRMGHEGLTVHGFRSTFRDWAAERTNFANEVVEMALAHSVGDKTEAAYRRGNLFLKRRRLIDAWAAYCAKPASDTVDVVPLHVSVA